jgi:CubicO group peptidase (beta-lactamase class C family)
MGIIHTPLQPAMKNMFSVRRQASPGFQVALGWHIVKASGFVQHSGQTNGYFSFIGYDPHRKIGVVVLSNSWEPTDNIFWHIVSYPTPGLVEEHIGPPNLPQ